MTVAHVFSAVLGMGAALSMDVLFHFYSADRKLTRGELRTFSILSRVVWYGIFAIATTGFGMFLSAPARYLVSVKFVSKMTIFAVLVINGVVVHFLVQRHFVRAGFFTSLREKAARHVAFLCGAISVVSWMSILTLGVMDSVSMSYGGVMAAYGAIVCVACVASLAIEYAKFERSLRL